MSKYYKPVENKYQAARAQRLKKTIARLGREIAAFEAKPAPKPADYVNPTMSKKVATERANAIAQRRTKIEECTAQLEQLLKEMGNGNSMTLWR